MTVRRDVNERKKISWRVKIGEDWWKVGSRILRPGAKHPSETLYYFGSGLAAKVTSYDCAKMPRV